MANFDVVRTLYLDECISPEKYTTLMNMTGICSIENKGKKLKLHYDVRKLQFHQILDETDLKISRTRLQQWKYNYYQFTDSNLAQASGHIPHCCNKIPRS
ncbi:MAG: hypothetical protein CENE_00618 [Candidatus Celerinatantimonas neptuna]|nr:MAG: hypothetical protein CENE_00618 [Candidatus Celerinatantimonas neptuna]